MNEHPQTEKMNMVGFRIQFKNNGWISEHMLKSNLRRNFKVITSKKANDAKTASCFQAESFFFGKYVF